MKPKTGQRAALFLLVAYCLDIVWKLAHWSELTSGLKWWGIALALTVRFAVMGFLLSVYLRLKKASQNPQAITTSTTGDSARSMRIMHRILLAVVGLYVILAVVRSGPAKDVPVITVETLSLTGFAMIVIAVGFRRKLLPPALAALQRDPQDPKALFLWRKATILSMTFALAVALNGIFLRAVGSNLRVALPFFVVAVILMLLWRPHLDVAVKKAGALGPTPS